MVFANNKSRVADCKWRFPKKKHALSQGKEGFAIEHAAFTRLEEGFLDHKAAFWKEG